MVLWDFFNILTRLFRKAGFSGSSILMFYCYFRVYLYIWEEFSSFNRFGVSEPSEKLLGRLLFFLFFIFFDMLLNFQIPNTQMPISQETLIGFR